MVQILLPLSLFAFVASITPGPNNIMLLASGVNFGFRATIPHMLGINIGFFILLLAVGMGLSTIFQTYPVLYQITKGVCLIYFLYLAWRIVSSAPGTDKAHQHKGRPLNFLEAAAFQWVNPKALIMAIGCFAAYAPPNVGTLLVITLSALFALINAPCISLWALFGSHLRHYLEQPLYRTIFNWTIAALLLLSLAPIILSQSISSFRL